jgi:hypothetical protein
MGTSTNRSCRYDSECRGGETCNNGRCESWGGQTCRYHSDCASGESCTNGYCQRPNGDQCRYDRDCRSGERCNNGICRSDTRFRAQCETRGISIRFPIKNFDISFGWGQETWLQEANASAVRVDACESGPYGNLRIDTGRSIREIRCTRCMAGDGIYTCYE